MATQYVLLVIMLWVGVAFSGVSMALHSAEIARATMSRYMQIALQQTANSAVTLNATNGTQWTKATDAAAPAEDTFQQDLTQTMAGTPWASMSIDITAFHIYTTNDIGSTQVPWGYPGTTITGPSYYAEVQFPWKVVSWLPAETIKVAEVMQANSLMEAGGSNYSWNPTQ